MELAAPGTRRGGPGPCPPADLGGHRAEGPAEGARVDDDDARGHRQTPGLVGVADHDEARLRPVLAREGGGPARGLPPGPEDLERRLGGQTVSPARRRA